MKKLLSTLLAVGMTASTLMAPMATFAAEEEVDLVSMVPGQTEVKRAILDTDMGYLNDDAIVMFMLAQADSWRKHMDGIRNDSSAASARIDRTF